MASARPVEATLLEPTRETLVSFLRSHQASLDAASLHEVLEAVACRLAGIDVSELWAFDDVSPTLPSLALAEAVDCITSSLARLPYHPAFALSSLAQPSFSFHERRTLGVYYTDFRLAQFLAAAATAATDDSRAVLDPSCGTGVLLVASALAVCGHDRTRLEDYIAHSVYASDISPEALRGARLALLSLCSSIDAVASLSDHLRELDSLEAGPTVWRDVAPEGFGTVIGNPPWERLKATHHEYLKAKGVTRHYGDRHPGEPDSDFLVQRANLRRRAASLASVYTHSGGGEVDLYQAFLELAMDVCSPEGRVSMLVPAGLIRSKGAASLRGALLNQGRGLQVTVMDNRTRFFAIDTRFKFVAVSWSPGSSPQKRVRISHGTGTETGVSVSSGVSVPSSTLRRIHQDLGFPEIRTAEEHRIFERMLAAGIPMSDPDGQWNAAIVRELDMTRDRQLFGPQVERSMPLVEGRMVHQYRCNAKRYVSGTGRRAVWRPEAPCVEDLVPQHWVPRHSLPTSLVERVDMPRVGFCDITGQTNERSMLAAKIPAGVVCGNKVPTILFDASRAGLSDLWVAIANSFSFDWFVRRVITTTVNFFILQSIPLAPIPVDSIAGRRILAMVRQIDVLQTRPWSPDDGWLYASARAEVDVLVARAYGLKPQQLLTILDDFPLIDRAQPALPGEARSTITRDFLMDRMTSREAIGASVDYSARVASARHRGAVPYVPTDLAAAILRSDDATIGANRCL